jgi:hypothetical protein
MRVKQLKYTPADGWKTLRDAPSVSLDLVLGFGAYDLLKEPQRYQELRTMFPTAHIVLTSTAGEICQTEVDDNTISVIAMEFERSRIDVARINIKDYNHSFIAGRELADRIPQSELRHVMIISDGQLVNGTYLLQGIQEKLPEHVTLSGGLAGDGGKFAETLTSLNEPPRPGEIISIGFYGENLSIGVGSQGGWDTFGPERVITRSEDNVLYELDGQNALELYKRYLGDKAAELPGAALLFPLSIQLPGTERALVRTILSIDEKSQSMTFAGNMPVGAKARLMRANFDRLIDGAAGAAKTAGAVLPNSAPEAGVLISCVGRKGILGPRIEEETESVADMLGGNPVLSGFYSYGEIARERSEVKCELHNQTMTITTFSEL